MKDIFMRMSLELLDEDFGSLETKNLCILALVYMSKYAHNVSGELYLSFSSLAKNLGVNKKKAIRIVGKLEEKKYIKNTGKKIKVGKFWLPVYQISLYERQQKSGTVNGTVSGTVNGTVKSSNDNIQNHIDGTVNGTVNGTVSGTKTNTEYITNTENKTNTYKGKSESVNEDFENYTEPVIDKPEIIRPAYLVTELPREENIDPKQLEQELQRLIAFYPRKSGNFRRLRDRYKYLRLKKKLRFEEIYEAVDGYMLEMDSQGIEQKYWKTLDTLFDPVELDPWLFKPTISIDKKGKRFKGEFCIATRVIRYWVPEFNRIESQVLSEKKVDQMIEEGRLIFLEENQLCHAK